jgi:hypothetical protein
MIKKIKNKKYKNNKKLNKNILETPIIRKILRSNTLGNKITKTNKKIYKKYILNIINII